jgi:hypothetical protein
MHYTSNVSGLLPGFSTYINFTTEPTAVKPLEKSPKYCNGIKTEVIF